MEKVDLLIEAGAVLPMTDEDVLLDGLIAIKANRIVYVGPAPAGRDRYVSDKVIGGRDFVAMPGLVNAHTHVGLHFYGTLCDEANVINALYDLIFPMESAFDAELMAASSSLGLWDAVRGGVTTICDHYHFPDATAQSMKAIGVRGVVADKIIEFTLDNPPRHDSAAQRYVIDYRRDEAERRLASNLDFIGRWKGDPLVTPALGPHAPDTVSTEILQECARCAEELDVKMLMHIAQSRAEVEQVRHKGFSGSIHYLSQIGFLSDRVQGAHMVYLGDDEIRIAGESRMGMSFNPIIMLACHSFPMIDKLSSSGVKIGMGTDCLSFDQLEEMRYTLYATNYLRGKGGYRLGAYDLLRMATIGGAEAVGLGDEIGTVEIGKKADVLVLDMRDAQLVPTTNYFESIAYYVKSRNVAYTIIDGRVVYADGHLQLVDESNIYERGVVAATEWLRRNQSILEATGVAARFDRSVLLGSALPD